MLFNIKNTVIVLIWLSISNYAISQSVEQLKLKQDSLTNIINQLDLKIKKLNEEKSNASIMLFNTTQLIDKTKVDKIKEQGTPVKTTTSAILREKPDFTAKELTNIPSGSIVVLYDYNSKPYFKASYNNVIGYISISVLENCQYVKDAENNALKKESPSLYYLTNKYGSANANRIVKHEYWLNMTSEMARESVGAPKTINRSTYSFGVHEQWVYDSPKRFYLYFEDGILTSIQD